MAQQRRNPARPAADPAPVITTKHIKLIGLFIGFSFLYRAFSQISPFFLLPSLSSLPKPNTCRIVHPAQLHNCEDLVPIPGSSLTFAACDPDRRKWNHFDFIFPKGLRNGELWLLDHTQPSKPPVKVKHAIPELRPLGVDVLVQSPGKKARAFVTNQASETSPSVEILDLDIETGASSLVATIRHPGINSPNSVSALSPTEFYIANDLWSVRRSKALSALEIASTVPGGSVWYLRFGVSGQIEEAKKVAVSAAITGMAIDRPGRRLFVTSALKGVYEYAIAPANSIKLSLIGHYRAPMIADNLKYNERDKALYLAGVPKLSPFMKYMGEPNAKKPESIVLRLVGKGEASASDVASLPLRKREWRWKTVFADDGGFYPAITGGAGTEQGGFVAAGLLEDGVCVCQTMPNVGKPKEERKEHDEL